jgi:hypothetical protein
VTVDELSDRASALGGRDRLLLIVLVRENPELGYVESEVLADFDAAELRVAA